MTPSSNDSPQGKDDRGAKHITSTDMLRNSRLDRELLAHIVEQTRSGDLSNLPDDERRAVMDVAKRLKGHAFCLSPVVTSLVEAVLPEAFRQLAGKSKQIQAMINDLARTLFDDPVANERLAALWADLNNAEK
jgi:hypothetical protein